MKLDVVWQGVIPDLLAWAQDQARSENIDLGALMNRALVNERRRLSGQRPTSARAAGLRGADARMGAGEWNATQLTRAVGHSRPKVDELIHAKILHPVRGGGHGNPFVFAWTEVLIAAVYLELGDRGFAVRSPLLADSIRSVDRTRGVFVLAADDAEGTPRAHVITDAGLAACALKYPVSTVIALEQLDKRLHDDERPLVAV